MQKEKKQNLAANQKELMTKFTRQKKAILVYSTDSKNIGTENKTNNLINKL